MISLATKHNDPEASLGWSERLGFGAGQLGMNMINGILGSFLTVYFTNVALLDAAVISSIIAVSKLFDGVSDLIVGRLVDNTKSKLGKGRSWLLRMCIPFAISIMLLFFIPQNWPSMVKYVYVFVMYNLVNAVCYTSMLVPYYSMISLITRNPYERGMLGNVQQIFQTLGNVIVNSFFTVLLAKFSSDAANANTQQAYTLTMLIVCIAMVVLSLICVISTKERVHETEAQEKAEEQIQSGKQASALETVKALLTNKYWVMITIAMLVIFFIIIFNSVGGIYYCMYVFYDMQKYSLLSNSISIAQFAIMFATPLMMKKFGKSAVYTIGMGIGAVGYLGFWMLGSNPILMIVFNALKGIGMGMSGGMAMGIVADTLTYGNLKSGIDTVGMGNAGVSAAQKIGMGLGTAVFGWILSSAGFDGSLDAQGLHQPESVTTAIKLVYNGVPFILTVAVFIMLLLFFHLERDLKKMQAEKTAE